MAQAAHRPFSAMHAGLAQINGSAAHIASALKTAAQARAAFARTAFELGSLTDRELADIGIPRSHIQAVARHAAQEVKAHAKR